MNLTSCRQLAFQSTLPRGSDRLSVTPTQTQRNFNPRSLAGATLTSCRRSVKLSFQSTLPRGSDLDKGWVYRTCAISIHAPSRERLQFDDFILAIQYFNPRSLAGATPNVSANQKRCCYFNPRSLAGATRGRFYCFRYLFISIHAPSRERHKQAAFLIYYFRISIHAPSRERLMMLLA